ncbi:MAG: phosphodiester glycosidase family protein [Actinocatenispora sp.]
MTRTRMRLSALVTAVVTSTVTLVGSAGPALADGPVTGGQDLAPGVRLSTFETPTAVGTATGDLLTVDLANRHVHVDLLHPDAVAARETVSGMTSDERAVAGVNADFFNIDESQHPGVAATGSSNGPEITHGRALKAAVPNSQRFGPAMAPGTSTQDVIGVGVDGRARLGSLRLVGSYTAPGRSGGRHELGGLNQYALPQNGVGAFTHDWGTVSRQRAVCGSDVKRGDPCSTDTAEVTVRRNRVVSVAATPGEGAIAADSTVLVGREVGAAQLRELRVGDAVRVSYHLAASARVPYRFAVGGAPILRDGAVLPGVDDTVSATRTAAGVSADGRRLYLVVNDGQAETGGGMTLREMADLLVAFGARSGINLDGGGSSTCAARLPGADEVTVVNEHPNGAAERAVANGIGVFSR